MSKKRIWTEETMKKIKSMAEQGCKAREIGEAVGIHPVTIRKKMHEMGLSDCLLKYAKNRVTAEEMLPGTKYEDICKVCHEKYKVGDKFNWDGRKKSIIEVSRFFMVLGGKYRTTISFADLHIADCLRGG